MCLTYFSIFVEDNEIISYNLLLAVKQSNLTWIESWKLFIWYCLWRYFIILFFVMKYIRNCFFSLNDVGNFFWIFIFLLILSNTNYRINLSHSASHETRIMSRLDVTKKIKKSAFVPYQWMDMTYYLNWSLVDFSWQLFFNEYMKSFTCFSTLVIDFYKYQKNTTKIVAPMTVLMTCFSSYRLKQVHHFITTSSIFAYRI